MGHGLDPDIPLPPSIDAEQFGESVRDSALPWDTVDTARFRRGAPLDATIETLIVKQDERSKDDPNFRYLLEGIREIEEARSRDSVSLGQSLWLCRHGCGRGYRRGRSPGYPPRPGGRDRLGLGGDAGDSAGTSQGGSRK